LAPDPCLWTVAGAENKGLRGGFSTEDSGVDAAWDWVEDERVRAVLAQLLAQIQGHQEQIQGYQDQIQELERKLTAAVEEIARLQEKRGSRPRGPRPPGAKGAGKKPGRRAGEGEFQHREAPELANAEVEEVAVPVQEVVCPDCGGQVRADGEEIATTVDLPKPRLKVKRFHVAMCACEACGKRFRGQHPDLPADQRGATAHRLGADLRDTAQWLHYRLGIPQRRVSQVFARLFDLPVTQSAFCQDAIRRVLKGPLPPVSTGNALLPAETRPWQLGDPIASEILGPVGRAYYELRRLVSQQERIHTDDTSWGVGGYAAWVMAFCNPELVVFQLRYWHRNEEVRELIPADYAGTMTCDGGPSYGARALSRVRQQKCVGHIQHNLADGARYLGARLAEFPLQVKGLLAEAMEAQRRSAAGEPVDLAGERARIDAAIGNWLERADLTNATHARLAGTLTDYRERGWLLRFLVDPRVEATNNLAERTLRFIVIARKLSQCSKNDCGAEVRAAWTSVFCSLELCNKAGPEVPRPAWTEIPGLPTRC